MTENIQGTLDWEMVDPARKAVVAAFACSVGDRPAELAPDEFQAAVVTAFPEIPDPVVKLGAHERRFSVLQSRMLQELSERPPKDVQQLVTGVGELAGDEEPVRVLANRAAADIVVKTRRYEALQPLQRLSELAVARAAA